MSKDLISVNLLKKFILSGILLFSFAGSLNAEIRVNEIAPGFQLRDINNKLVFISRDLKSKPVLIIFFFTDCLPCKKELPEIQSLYSRYGANVSMYLISTDAGGIDDVKPYLSGMNITIPVLIDKYMDAARLYAIDRYPSMFLIGSNGRLKFCSYGYDEGNLKKLQKILNKLK